MSESEGGNKSDPGDPCNSYAWSVVFCFIMALSLLTWLFTVFKVPHSSINFLVFLLVLFKTLKSRKTRGASLSGLDKLVGLLALATLIQFVPMLSTSLHQGHNVYSYSQTGCKLLTYTTYGIHHVITALVCSLMAYAYYGLHHGFESVSARLSNVGFGWILLGLAAVQGIFGMVPAM